MSMVKFEFNDKLLQIKKDSKRSPLAFITE